MNTASNDLLLEYRALDSLCRSLTPGQWSLPSAFFGWTPWDEVAHLCFFDEAGLQAAADAPAFLADAAQLQSRLMAGEEISAMARARYGHLDGPQLLGHWRGRYEAIARHLGALDPKTRLPWYGPPMSALSFATARLMETWAHGQDIWDVIGQVRPPSDRLKHIAHLGVTTFAWTFVNRQLPPPATVPYVRLQAGDASCWTWGEASATDSIEGSATDFCLVVTQRRNVRDTRLALAGDAARRWMDLAQCFAGPPADPPVAGSRGVGR